MLSKPASQITLNQVVVAMEGIDSGAVERRGFKKALRREALTAIAGTQCTSGFSRSSS
ncbi:MAG: hypothetical protein O7C39_00590 [Bacteroidetes bacterium]|nr:hypothetical protein [Bacteroidota bacterium]